MMRKLLYTLFSLTLIALYAFPQSSTYPPTGSPTIYDYSPTVFLQRNTNDGGFTEGIQTRFLDGSDNWYFGTLHTDNWIVSKGSYQNIKLLVSSGGNVGIGTTVPVSPLHVYGGTSMSAGWNKTSTLQALYPVQIFNSNATKWAGIGYDYSSALRFWVNATSDDLSTSGTAALSILNNANVSICAYDSQGYKLAVNGTIHSKEVKVDMAGWPDYVFDSSYQLPDLDDTELFIKKNKHLPEIPAAKEVELEGIKLGEMNATLVKKIEELTLYLFELKKTVQKQQKEIDQLKVIKTL